MLIVILDVSLTNIQKQYNLYMKKRWNEAKKTIRINHPIYHHTFKKNSFNKETGPAGDYTIYTNSLGFKDKSSRTIPASSPNERIVFIGDSFTEGVALNYKDTFVGIIDSVLSERGIEVLNAARASYSPIIYWKKIKYLIEDEGLKINKLVVFLDISDVQDEALYYSDDQGIVIKNKNVGKDQEIERKKVDKLIYLKDAIWRNTTVMAPVLNFVHDLIGFDQVNSAEKMDRPNSNFSERSLWTLTYNSNSEWVEKGLKEMKKYMNKLLEITQKNNIELSIAVYPWPAQIIFDDLNSIHVRIWYNYCLKNNIKFINLFPLFIDVKSTSEDKLGVVRKYYLRDGVHFNKRGNELISEKFLYNFFNDS